MIDEKVDNAVAEFKKWTFSSGKDPQETWKLKKRLEFIYEEFQKQCVKLPQQFVEVQDSATNGNLLIRFTCKVQM